jgi:hypothetical protein
MRKQTEKNKDMSLDQQIMLYEDRISQLEQMKRTMILQDNNNPLKKDSGIIEKDLDRINIDLDDSYEHVAILKIRKMMGF